MSLNFYTGDAFGLDIDKILGEDYGKVKTSEIYDNVTTIYPTILIRRENEVKSGSIWLPDEKRHDSRYARVIAVHNGQLQSDGTRTHMPTVSPGDLVIVLNLDGDNLNDADDPYLEKCREPQIMAVIEEIALGDSDSPEKLI